MTLKEPKFNIGEEVYHKISGEKGMIGDIAFYYRSEIFMYNVDLGFNQESFCREDEITRDRVFE